MDTGTCEDDLEWEEWNPSKISFVNHMIAGSFAGIVEHVSIYPIDTIKTHIQYEKSPSFRPLHSFRSLISGEGGFFRLWRGVSATFAGCIPAHSAYFAVFEASKLLLEADKEGHHPVAAAACGSLAAVSHDMFLTPFDVVKQRMQLGYYKNVVHCVRTILKTEGIGALYASFPTTLMMNIPFGGIMMAVNESMKKVLNPSGEYNFWTTMASGSVAGMVAAACTTPLDVVKTRLQTQNLEHCTKSCEDPHFNPPSSSAGTAGPLNSSGVGAPTTARSARSTKGANDGPFARRYRRRQRPVPAMGPGGAGHSLAGELGITYTSNGGGLTSSNRSFGATGGITGGSKLQPGALFSTSAAQRVPNMRMRALMTSARPRRAVQSLGSYSKQRAGPLTGAGTLQFTIHREAVVRALSSTSGGGGSGALGSGPAAVGGEAVLQRLGMVEMVRRIHAQEGVRGFLRGVVPRMLVQAPSVAISWTAYETMKMLLS